MSNHPTYDAILKAYKPNEMPRVLDAFIEFFAEVWNGGAEQWADHGDFDRDGADVIDTLRTCPSAESKQLYQLLRAGWKDLNRIGSRNPTSREGDDDFDDETGFASLDAIDNFVYTDGVPEKILQDVLHVSGITLPAARAESIDTFINIVENSQVPLTPEEKARATSLFGGLSWVVDEIAPCVTQADLLAVIEKVIQAGGRVGGPNNDQLRDTWLSQIFIA